MNESKYYEQWVSASQNTLDNPRALAIQTGKISPNPAFVFIAGYQAAIRATFAELKQGGWIAYAASEDRSSESPKPGVTHRDGCLFGFKTWVAASKQINTLVVKVGRGPEAFYAHLNNLLASPNEDALDKRPEGLTITTKTDPRFLPDISQGIVEFDQTPFKMIADVSRVKQFGTYEPYYIYVSFLASLIAHQPKLSETANEVLNAHPNSESLAEMDLAVQGLIEKLNAENWGYALAGDNWEIDQRLYTMYSPMIQKK